MKIRALIDQNFVTTSIFEDTRDVSVYLNSHDYLVVVDEEKNIAGIVTLKDILAQPEGRNLSYCNIGKPAVTPVQTIFEAFSIMQGGRYDCLPVYEAEEFIGVISLRRITGRFAQALTESKNDYQRVIHDLRNPVSNLNGLVHILYESVTDAENHDYLKLCHLSCKHAMDILDDLLYVEKDENRKLMIEATDINRFYMQCVDEQLGLSLLKNIKIQTELTDELIVKDIDRIQLKRAVQNVISNAIKFSYPNSVIKISSKTDGDKVILKIVDAGIGIPKKYQPDIFKRFTPAGRERTVSRRRE